MSKICGTYIKGHGYTPIFCCTRYSSGLEFPLAAVGSGLTFDMAIKYAYGDVNDYLKHGWQIDTEYEDEERYICTLIYPGNNDYVCISVNKCPLMHE